MLQLVNFLAQNARQLPDKTALVFKERSLTWKELNAQVNALANGLSDIGVCKGDTVAYFMRNSVELVVIWWATQKIGAIALPVSTFLLPREIEEILSVTDCKTIIYQDIKDFRSRLESATENLPHPLCTLVIGRAAQGEIDFCDLLSQSSDEESEIELEEEDGSLLLFTSGTTGAPKGVLRTQRIVRDYALMLAIENTTDRNEIVLMTHCPMFHTAGMSILMRAAVLGAPLILVEGCHEQEVLSLIDRHRVTHLLFVPPTLYVRLAAVDDGSYDLSSVVEAQCSGGVASPADVEAMHRMFPRACFRFSWGSTETCSPTSACVSHAMVVQNPELCSTIGKLNVMVSLKLIDPETGEEVAKGEVGEAYVQSSMVTGGYLKNREKTQQAFNDGWFKTNDLLREDDEGYYYLMGRTTDLIKTGGENVYASEVERVLAEHSAIHEAAVVGIPDDRLGQAVACVVVLREGYELNTDDLLAHCKERLSGFKKPRYIAYSDSLPRNSVGKVLKTDLSRDPNIVFSPIKRSCC